MDLLIDRMQDSNRRTNISLAGKDLFKSASSTTLSTLSTWSSLNKKLKNNSHSSGKLKSSHSSSSSKLRKQVPPAMVKKQPKYMDKTFSFPKKDPRKNKQDRIKTDTRNSIKYEKVKRNNGANKVSTIEDNNDYDDILDRVNMKNIFTTIIKQEKQLRKDREREHKVRREQKEMANHGSLHSTNSTQSRHSSAHKHHHVHGHLHNQLHNLTEAVTDYTSATTGCFSEVMFGNPLNNVNHEKNRVQASSINNKKDPSRLKNITSKLSSSHVDYNEDNSESCHCLCPQCNSESFDADDMNERNILINNNMITNDQNIIGDRNYANADTNFKKFNKFGEKYHKHHHRNNATNSNTNNNTVDTVSDIKDNNENRNASTGGYNGVDNNLNFITANKRLVYQFLKSMAPPSMDQLQLQGIPFVSETPLLSQLNIAQRMADNKLAIPNNTMTSKKSLQSLLFHDLENINSSPYSRSSYSISSMSSVNDEENSSSATESSSILSIGKRKRKNRRQQNKRQLRPVNAPKNDKTSKNNTKKIQTAESRTNFGDMFNDINIKGDHIDDFTDFEQEESTDEDSLRRFNKNDDDFYQNHISSLINRYAEVMKANLIDNIHKTESDFQKNVQNFDLLVNQLRNLQNELQLMKLKLNDNYLNLLNNSFNSNGEDLFLNKLKEKVDLNVEQLESFEMRMQISQENLIKQKDELKKMEEIIAIEKKISRSREETSYWIRYKLLLFDLLTFSILIICFIIFYRVFFS